ncbi:MAG: aminopeptidase P family protein [Acidobacteria bacterium]|nr:aminopeptidase P family protein [Acidobacteriota bacterium]
MRRGRWMILALGLSLAWAVEKPATEVYKQRRARLMEQISQEEGAKAAGVIVWGARAADLEEFRQLNDFMYLTGVETPDSILILDATAKKETLYIPPRDPRQERWTGPQVGPGEEAVRLTGFDQVKGTDTFQGDFQELSSRVGVLYTRFPPGPAHHPSREQQQVEKIQTAAPFLEVKDVRPLIAEMRKIKDPGELQLLQKAIDITAQAHRTVMKELRPGVHEYELEALIEYTFRKNGAERSGFPSIVGSGFFSTVLHYDKNTQQVKDGDLVVVDIGAEYSYYTADITRTYPVGGKFSRRQREIYQIVLDAQKKALEQVKPGAIASRAGEIHKAALKYIEEKGFGKHFIHGTSHYLGMDVHDVGNYTIPLKPGEVITVEPGIYIPEENLGVRIEDDFLITETGYIHLSKDIPREVDEIERMMKLKTRN